MSLLLIRPEIDQWKPGEHSGTFRGNNLAFVTATEALRYWEDDNFAAEISGTGEWLRVKLDDLRREFPAIRGEVRGAGLILGLQLADTHLATAVSRGAFERGVVIELCGKGNDVLKFLPPLVIEQEVLEEGLEVIRQSIAAAGRA
jgi:diaminobutyrate-2-oxoglutarate transaminase